MEENTTPFSFKAWARKHSLLIILIFALIVSNLGIYLYQSHTHKVLHQEYMGMSKRMSEESNRLLIHRVESGLTSLTKALVNSVRAEMLRGNKEQLDRFMIEMVQKTEIDLMVVVDTDEMVYLSTDKEFQDRAVKENFPALNLKIESPVFLESKAEKATIAAPIMGEDRRLGTLVISVQTDNESLKILKNIQQEKKKLDLQ